MTSSKPRHSGRAAFLAFAAVAAVFVWLSSIGMPETVASHFGAAGAANGYMPRSVYAAIMIGFVTGLPVIMVLMTSRAVGRPDARINLPHRDYWLAPQRREATIARLRRGVQFFGVVLIVFLCYVHWLVVRANLTQPARLPQPWFTGGLVVFAVVVLGWLWGFLGHYRHAD